MWIDSSTSPIPVPKGVMITPRMPNALPHIPHIRLRLVTIMPQQSCHQNDTGFTHLRRHKEQRMNTKNQWMKLKLKASLPSTKNPTNISQRLLLVAGKKSRWNFSCYRILSKWHPPDSARLRWKVPGVWKISARLLTHPKSFKLDHKV